MRFLIVNGDDFGLCRGFNRGILEAHQRGILTSTSLLVNSTWSEGSRLPRAAAPELSIGLHVDLQADRGRTPADSRRRLREGLDDQLGRFEELVGRPPTHVDSHDSVHRDARR